jgi:hypothetical protein
VSNPAVVRRRPRGGRVDAVTQRWRRAAGRRAVAGHERGADAVEHERDGESLVRGHGDPGIDARSVKVCPSRFGAHRRRADDLHAVEGREGRGSADPMRWMLARAPACRGRNSATALDRQVAHADLGLTGVTLGDLAGGVRRRDGDRQARRHVAQARIAGAQLTACVGVAHTRVTAWRNSPSESMSRNTRRATRRRDGRRPSARRGGRCVRGATPISDSSVRARVSAAARRATRMRHRSSCHIGGGDKVTKLLDVHALSMEASRAALPLPGA